MLETRINKKNGKPYEILLEGVINCDDGQLTIVYKDVEGLIYCRNRVEFVQKFRKVFTAEEKSKIINEGLTFTSDNDNEIFICYEETETFSGYKITCNSRAYHKSEDLKEIEDSFNRIEDSYTGLFTWKL